MPSMVCGSILGDCFDELTTNDNPNHDEHGKFASAGESHVAKLEEEVKPHLEKDAGLRALFNRVTKRVTDIAKTAAFQQLTKLSLKTADQWLFEQTINAHQLATSPSHFPVSATLTAKVATLATVKAWMGLRKLKAMTTNEDGTTWDEADNLKAVLDALADASEGAMEAPDLEEVQERLKATENANPDQPRDAHGRWVTGEGTKDEHDAAIDKEWNRITGGKVKDFKESQKAMRQARKNVGEWTPHAKQGIDLNDSTALAKAVHAAAKQVPDAISGHANDGTLASWESHKPLIADVHDAMREQLGGASLDKFKAALLKAHQEGKVELSRNDLPQLTKDTAAGTGPERSAKSEVRHGVARSEWDVGNAFHTINTNGPAARTELTGNSNPNHDDQGRFAVGDSVHREGYGVGTVIRVHPKGQVTVRLPNGSKPIDLKQPADKWTHHGTSQHVADAVREVAGETGLAPLHKVRDELAKRGITERKHQDAVIEAARGDSVTGSNVEGRHGISDEEREGLYHAPDGSRIGFLSIKHDQ